MYIFKIYGPYLYPESVDFMLHTLDLSASPLDVVVSLLELKLWIKGWSLHFKVSAYIPLMNKLLALFFSEQFRL